MSNLQYPESHDESGTTPSRSQTQPACDICRARKVRCDRTRPCSNCRASQTVCRTTKKAPEKRTRVLLSTSYQSDLKDIKHKLELISQSLLSGHDINIYTTSISSHPSNSSKSSNISHINTDNHVTNSEIPFEGESSFKTHSTLLAQALDSEIGNSPVPSELMDALAVVTSPKDEQQQPILSSSDIYSSIQGLWRYLGVPPMSLPPMELVLKMLKVAKVYPQKLFKDYLFLDINEVTSLCQRFYFPAEEFTAADFLAVNCALFFLFRDVSKEVANNFALSTHELNSAVNLTASNIDSVVKRLRLTIEPEVGNIQALLLAVSMFMETNQAPLAGTLLKTVCRLCQEAGLHRLPSKVENSQARKKKLLFWMAYVLDRGFALNYGHSPILQDYDIGVNKPLYPVEICGPGAAAFIGWIQYAELQGNIYEQLFSVHAQRLPQSQRTDRALNLAERLHALQASGSIEYDGGHPQEAQATTLQTKIIMSSMLTLIYRIIPATGSSHPLQFSDSCLNAARMALVTLNDAWTEVGMKDTQAWGDFLHWTVQFHPFTPYIVVMSNVIAQKHKADLELLEKAIVTLQGATEHSAGIRKLYEVCRNLFNIATMYMRQNEASIAAAVRAGNQSGPSGVASNDNVSDYMAAFQEPLDIPLFVQDWDPVMDGWAMWLEETSPSLHSNTL